MQSQPKGVVFLASRLSQNGYSPDLQKRYRKSNWLQSIGLRWSLNAGGVITRTVRGVPDELENGYLNTGEMLRMTPSGSVSSITTTIVVADFSIRPTRIANNSILIYTLNIQ